MPRSGKRLRTEYGLSNSQAEISRAGRWGQYCSDLFVLEAEQGEIRFS